MSKKKKQNKPVEKDELQERIKKEEELFENLFGVSIKEVAETDIEKTLNELEKIEQDTKIPQKKKTRTATLPKPEELEASIIDMAPPLIEGEVEEESKINTQVKLEIPEKIKPKAIDTISTPPISQENREFAFKEVYPLPKPKSITIKPKISAVPPKISPKTVVPALKGVSKPSSISIKREFDYIGGNIRFKVVVRNISNMIISDINIILNPTSQFSISERMKPVNLLKPGESRGIDFILTPLDCGTSNVYGTVSYVDYHGQPSSLTIEPKEIQIKCPLVQPKQIEEEKLQNLKKSLQKSSFSIDFLAISANQAYNIVREQISALDVCETYNDPENFKSEWTGAAKVTGNELIISASISDNVALEVYSQDIKQATGLLAYIKNIIKLAIDNAQKVGGKIEQIGVKILDSFDLCKKLIQLASLCEIQTFINDIVSILRDTELKMMKSYPETKIAQKITLWINQLSKELDQDTMIDERVATDLEFDIIQWLKEIKSVTQTNAKIYQETFTEYAKLGSVQEGLDALYLDIDEIEQKYSMKILRYLLVVQKDSGITVYREKLGSDVELDPFLVSGFLSAISSFGTELSMSKKETTMKKLTYEDFEIEIEDGEYVRAALLLQGKSTKFLLDRLLDFIQNFEEEFASVLIDWSGNMGIFKQASDLLLKIMPGIKIYPATEKELQSTITLPKPEAEEPLEEEISKKGTPGVLKVVSFPMEDKKAIKIQPVKVITPKPVLTATKIQAEESIGELSEYRCSFCGTRISKKDLTSIEMGFIIPCKECGNDLIGEAIRKEGS